MIDSVTVLTVLLEENNNAKLQNAIAKTKGRNMFGKKPEFQPDLELFVVFDTKTNSYREPFPAPNSAVVLRDFETAFKKPNAAEVNQYYINSEDYKLFKIGAFDLKQGKLDSYPPEHVINFHDLRAAVDLKSSPRALSAT